MPGFPVWGWNLQQIVGFKVGMGDFGFLCMNFDKLLPVESTRVVRFFGLQLSNSLLLTSCRTSP